jgi:hypothetical protein
MERNRDDNLLPAGFGCLLARSPASFLTKVKKEKKKNGSIVLCLCVLSTFNALALFSVA